MSCSICGKDGHNARTCQNIATTNQENRDHALWVKFDNITREESSDLLKNIVDSKDIIAPNARGTWARGSVRELPDKIKQALKENNNE